MYPFNKAIVTPIQTIVILLKEAHRAKGILGGVDLGMTLYPDAVFITVIFGFLKGI
jgi:small nuclear ribonucleoprotein (snRNP)-like protein